MEEIILPRNIKNQIQEIIQKPNPEPKELLTIIPYLKGIDQIQQQIQKLQLHQNDYPQTQNKKKVIEYIIQNRQKITNIINQQKEQFKQSTQLF